MIGIALIVTVVASVGGAAPDDTKAVAIKISPVDYPRESLRLGEQGRVEYSFTVTARGKVKNCVVTKSTGFERLDKATCVLIRNTTYAPARTGGQAVAEDKIGAMNWRVTSPTTH